MHSVSWERLLRLRSLKLDEARFTRVAVSGAADVQASVDLVFGPPEAGPRFAAIETNWTLGVNRKTTRISYAHSSAHVLLDHSQERVVIFQRDRCETIELGNGRPRLVNQYAALFDDLYGRFLRFESNLEFAVPIHRLLFEAQWQQPSGRS